MDAVVKWYSVGGQVGDRLPRLEPHGWGLSAEPVIPKNQGRARAAGLVHTLKELLDFEVAAAFEEWTSIAEGRRPFIVEVALPSPDALRAFVIDHLSASREFTSTETSLVFEHVRGSASTWDVRPA